MKGKRTTNVTHSCEILFSSASNLKVHINAIHKKLKNHKCESCGKSFSSNFLKKHINIHKGHKDFKCFSCGKLFYDRTSMLKHFKEVHEGRKDYKCDECGKSFTQLGNMKKHIHIQGVPA